MNTTKSFLTLGALACLLIAGAMVFGQSEGESHKSITGVWIAQIQGRDCSTGNPFGPGGIGLITFADGGTLSESSTIPAGPAPLPVPFSRGPGHGVWNKRNAREFTASYMLQRLNADGTFAGWTKLRGAIQLADGGAEFSWTGTGEFISPAGAVLMTTCNTMTATRFQ